MSFPTVSRQAYANVFHHAWRLYTVYFIFQILHKLAKVQGFENEKSYIQTYLPYLIHQWLCLQYSMEDFPFQVAFCDSKHSFYRLISFYI